MQGRSVSTKTIPKKKELQKKVSLAQVKSSESKKAKVPVKLSSPDFSDLEEDARKRADKVLTAIEKFLAKWDVSKVKAVNSRKVGLNELSRIKAYYDALSLWQKNSLKTKNDDDKSARIKRLRSFVAIYRTFSSR